MKTDSSIAGGASLPKGATLIFADDFNRKDLGAYAAGNVDEKLRARLNWTTRKGKWEIRAEADGNGALFGVGDPGEIFYDKAVGVNFRLEYTAWSSHPGDRSVYLSVPLPNFEYKDVYLFQFAGGYSKYNGIYRFGKALVEPTKAILPVPGKKNQVVIQKVDDLMEMWIDGTPLFSVKDPDYDSVRADLGGPQGCRLGFFTWSDGMYFDDLKLYNLPGPRSEMLAADAKVEYSLWQGFDDQNKGPAPKGVTVQSGKNCAVAFRNEPTLVYQPKPKGQALVEDFCVELKDADPSPKEVAALTLATRSLKSGEVEVELLANSYEGECATISLVNAEGADLAAVVIGADGTFYAKTAEGLKKLKDRISYKNRPPNARLYFQPRRWFSIRLGFNVDTGVFQVSLVNLYAGYATQGISYYPLGMELPLAAKGEVNGLRIATGAKAELLVDNLCVASPRAVKLNGKPVTTPLREILGLTYPLRNDPPSFAVYPLRNEGCTRHPVEQLRNAFVRPSTPVFEKAVARYEPLLVRQSLLEERGNTLARMRFHLEQAGASNKVPPQTDDILKRARASRTDLEKLYRIYATAFRDGLNEAMLTEKMLPAADRLEALLASLEKETETAAGSLVAAAGNEAAPAPKLAPAPYEAPLEWRNHQFERGGKPAFVYPPFGVGAGEFRGRLLGLDNCHAIPMILDEPGKTGRVDKVSFSWPVSEGFINEYVLKPEPAASFLVQSLFGCVHIMQMGPAWWFEKHKSNPDIFFCSREGKIPNWDGADQPYVARPVGGGRYAGGGGYWSRLNFWNPDVKELYRVMFDEWGQRMNEKYPGRVKLFLLGLEQSNFALTETGFNESAIAAFRNRLKTNYQAIAALNKNWGTAYSSFEEIDPRKYFAKCPNGELYEFQMFRQEGYWKWTQQIRQDLKKNLPEVVTMNDFNYGLGGTGYERSLDLPSMFKSYDVVGFHSYDLEGTLPMYRCLDSLRKAYGNPLGNFEWAAGLHLDDLFSEEAYKSCGLLDMFEEMAWGKQVLSIWYGGSAGFSEGAQYFAPSLANSILRYSTAFVPVARQRARRLGPIALTFPTVTPPVALMEPTSSQFNGLEARGLMLPLAKALEKRRWNYGFIYENALLEKRQSLDGIKTLILPSGLCLKPEVSLLLLNWVRQGGTLIAILPPGIFNQYGQPAGALMRELMSGVAYTLNEDFTQMTVTGREKFAGAVADTDDQTGKILSVSVGKGKFHLLTVSRPCPEQAVLKLVEAATPRDMALAQGHFRVIARESPGRFYLFVVNPDYFETKTDTIILPGKRGKAADMGCDAAFPVKTKIAGNTTAFELRLAPGEGTVVRLEKQ